MKEFESALFCVKDEIQEPSKHPANFKRGNFYGPTAAHAYQRSSGLLLVESSLSYGASRDRIFGPDRLRFTTALTGSAMLVELAVTMELLPNITCVKITSTIFGLIVYSRNFQVF